MGGGVSGCSGVEGEGPPSGTWGPDPHLGVLNDSAWKHMISQKKISDAPKISRIKNVHGVSCKQSCSRHLGRIGEQGTASLERDIFALESEHFGVEHLLFSWGVSNS